MSLCLNLSGGGRWVFYMLGSLQHLKQVGSLKEENITALYGSSIGSVVALLLALNKTVEEIILIFQKVTRNISITQNIQLAKFFTHFGLVDMTNLLRELNQHLHIPDNFTFADLSKDLTVTGFAVKEGTTKYFSKINTPTMPVMLAIQISCTIPVIFQCVPFNGDLYVDGGTVDWLPEQNQLRHKLSDTIAINLTPGRASSINNVFSFISFLIKGIQKQTTKTTNTAAFKEYYDIEDTIETGINIFAVNLCQEYINSSLQSGATQTFQQRIQRK